MVAKGESRAKDSFLLKTVQDSPERARPPVFADTTLGRHWLVSDGFACFPMFSFHGKRPLDEEDRALSSPFEKKRRAEPHGEAEQEEHTENECYQEEEPGETDDLGEGEAFAQEEAPGEGEDGEEKQEEPLEQDERAYDEGPVSKSFHALEAEMKDFVHSILPCGEQVCNKNKNACFCTCCHPFPPSTQMLKAD